MQTHRNTDGLKAARTLQRRFRARVLYRQRRDRKLRDEWLGREFNLSVRSELTGLPYTVRLRLSRYRPEVAVVNMSLVHDVVGTVVKDAGTLAWSTDEFWSRLKTGQLVEA